MFILQYKIFLMSNACVRPLYSFLVRPLKMTEWWKVVYFRVLLFEIGEDIDDEEFKSVMFTLTSVVPKGQLSKMKSIFDLFLFLEKKDEMSHTKVDVLLKVLKVIDRADLIPKVNKYISLQSTFRLLSWKLYCNRLRWYRTSVDICLD